MAKRKKKSSPHNSKVKREADRLRRAGWNVKAAIPGYLQPSQIGKDKKIPDIEAKKAGSTRLIEVETKDSSTTDRAQQSTFRRSAAQRKKTTFKVVVAKKRSPKKKRKSKRN